MHIHMVSTWNSSSNPNSSQPWLLSCEGAPPAPHLPRRAALQAREGSALKKFARFRLLADMPSKALIPPLSLLLVKGSRAIFEGVLRFFGDSLYHALCCLGQSKFEVCKPAERVAVFKADSRADPRGLEVKQKWGETEVNCTITLSVPSLLSLCKLTSHIVYGSSVQSFKQIPLFFPLIEHEWVT